MNTDSKIYLPKINSLYVELIQSGRMCKIRKFVMKAPTGYQEDHLTWLNNFVRDF